MLNLRKLFKRKTKVVNVKFRMKHDLVKYCEDPNYIIIRNRRGEEVKVFARAYKVQGFFGKTRAISEGKYEKEVKSYF